MMTNLVKVFALFSKAEKIRIYGIFLAIVVMGLLEMLGVASIAPFTAVASNPELIHTNGKLKLLYELIQPESLNDFLIVLGITVLVLITLSNLFAAFTTWAILRFTNLQGHRLSKKLFRKYLMQPYAFFLDRNSAELSKNMFSEVGRVVVGVLSPGMQVIAKMIVVLCVLTLLFVTDPLLTITIFSVLGGFYLGVFTFVRRRVSRLGKIAVQRDGERYRAASEAFGGIKELKLTGSEGVFISRYSEPSELLAMSNASSQTMSQLPRYFLEIVAFGSVMAIMLYLLVVKGGIGQALPFIALYTFAGYRLMPAMQQIFNGMAMIRYNAAALDLLHEDITGQQPSPPAASPAPGYERIIPKNEIKLQGVTYTYPGESAAVIEHLDLWIEANSTVGIVGPTGSGKTTILDIFLGLLMPEKGGVHVDGMVVTQDRMRSWQAALGYVPQSIFLVDNTITKNIAFGVPDDEIDHERVELVGRMANLHEFIISSLSDGYGAIVGENGVKLSGGQRQRIGIARALYHNPGVLVLDEATSALDGHTERAIMNEIYGLSERKTVVIVAHRLATIEQCDVIYFLEKGKVLASGTYQELLETCESFRKLAKVPAPVGSPV